MEGYSPCGRSNLRIKGWMGRADQTTKIRGMFIRPEQVAAFVAKHSEVARVRVIVSRVAESDVMAVKIEGDTGQMDVYAASIVETLKLRAQIEVVATGTLPKDGVIIEDQRIYD